MRRILGFLVVLYSVPQIAFAAEPQCASINLFATRADSQVSVGLVNRSSSSATIEGAMQDFGWTVYERKGKAWLEFVSGGVGGGGGSAGAPINQKPNDSAAVEPNGQKHLDTFSMTELGVVPSAPKGRYKVVFRYGFKLNLPSGEHVQCSIISAPLAFNHE